jgi:hypothetical protein
LSFAVFAQNTKSPSQAAPASSTNSNQARHPRVVAYYFHGDVRCVTCRKLESLSHDVLTSDFAAQLKSGEVEWQVVNVDLPENTHFIRDYQLVSKSLVLVKYENGKQIGYKNLQDVWRLVNKEQAYRNYVKGELQAALGRG